MSFRFKLLKAMTNPARQKRLFASSLALSLLAGNLTFPSLVEPAQAAPTLCATPGKDGPGGTLSGVVNTYYPGTGSVSAGATSISVGTPIGSTAIAAGDLLLIIQMQDATVDSTNTAAYGDGVGSDVPAYPNDPPPTGASGYLSTTAGRYEYVLATGSVSGGAVPIKGVNGGGLINSYSSTDATVSQGKKTFQVVRVPQYSSATLGSATATPWDGSVGGILAYDVAGNLSLTGTVDVSGRGFRGGGGRRLRGKTGGTNTDYRTAAPTPADGTSGFNGAKGEGIAGTPRYVMNAFASTPTIVDTSVDGYPNGSFGRGSGGNGGGGSTDGNPSANDQNSGGGGGSNGGTGGLGGKSWSSNLPTGGFGGKAFAERSSSRLILGGGGGAGTTNDGTTNTSSITSTDGRASSGAAGGGMVMIRTNTVSNSGMINANGADAYDVKQDGGGGGGAGGSVLVSALSNNLSGLTVNANGGKGGSPVFSSPHGPGGGGGGGVVVTSSGASISTAGGASGLTGSPATNPFSATSGTGLSIPIALNSIPGVNSGAECKPQLTVTKTTSTPTVTNQATGTTATYTIAVSNAASFSTATGISISDNLPSGFSYSSTSAISLSGGAVRTSTSDPTAGVSNPKWGDFNIPAGGQVQITFIVAVAANVTTGTYQNPVLVSYLDPTRTTTNGTTSASYDPASSTNEDVTVNSDYLKPKLLLVKRITAINNDNRNDYIDDPNSSDDNASNWPSGSSNGISTYLRGAISGVTARPGDSIEYTIYFLSSGGSPVTNVTICDLIPLNSSFISSTYNGLTPGDGGLFGAESGIALAIGSMTPTAYLSNTNDSPDRGQFYAANTSLPNSCSGANVNGAVVVQVVTSPATLPNGTGPGTPSNSYGFIRFRVRVN